MPQTYANGHISATGDPIHFMFGSTVGFSGTADLMALFPVRTNPRWRRPPSWIISNGHISATAHDLRRSRGHLCDSTAFLITFVSVFGETGYYLKSSVNMNARNNIILTADVQCWNWPKRTVGSAAEMFEILPMDWNLKPILTQNGCL